MKRLKHTLQDRPAVPQELPKPTLNTEAIDRYHTTHFKLMALAGLIRAIDIDHIANIDDQGNEIWPWLGDLIQSGLEEMKSDVDAVWKAYRVARGLPPDAPPLA